MALSIQARLTGGVNCLALHGPSGSELRTTAPRDNGGDGSLFSPTDLVATALATCVLTILSLTARKHDLDLTGTTAEVEKTMSQAGPRRIASVPLTVTVPVPVPPQMRRKLEAAARHCPVHRSLSPQVEAPITFRWA